MTTKVLILQDMLVDRIVLNFYGIRIPHLTYDNFKRIVEDLQESIFTVATESLNYHKFRFRKKYGVIGEATFRFDPNSGCAHMSMNVTLNATRSLREQLDQQYSSPLVKSLDGNTNFIPNYHAKMFTEDALQKACISQVITRAQAILDDIQSTASDATSDDLLRLTGTRISVHEIELYWDVSLDGALVEVNRLASRFRSIFKETYSHSYPIGRTSTGMVQNSMSLFGEIQKGEILKVYAKTPRIIRFEIVLKKSRIRGLVGSNVLHCLDTGSLIDFCHALSEIPLQHLNQFMEKLDLESTDWSLTLLLYTINKRCRTYAESCDIIQILAARGGVKYCAAYGPSTYRLRDAGVLRVTQRGVYACSQRDQELLRFYLEEIRLCAKNH